MNNKKYIEFFLRIYFYFIILLEIYFFTNHINYYNINYSINFDNLNTYFKKPEIIKTEIKLQPSKIYDTIYPSNNIIYYPNYNLYNISIKDKYEKNINYLDTLDNDNKLDNVYKLDNYIYNTNQYKLQLFNNYKEKYNNIKYCYKHKDIINKLGYFLFMPGLFLFL